MKNEEEMEQTSQDETARRNLRKFPEASPIRLMMSMHCKIVPADTPSPRMITCLLGTLVVGLIGELIGWLVGWLVGWLISWLVGWLVGWLAGWLVGWLIGWL